MTTDRGNPSGPPPADGLGSPADEAGGAPDSRKVAAGSGEGELRVQRSRFLAVALPAADEAAVRRHLAAVGRRHHDARHVAHAWRVGAGAELREGRHDGGEPSGTAGEPILVAIRQAGLTDVVVAVARWFGGVKLGTGGLARAYGQAAAAALATVPRRRLRPGRRYRLEFPYARQGALAGLLERHGGTLLEQDYSDRVRWRAWLPRARADRFAAAASEQTAGELVLTDEGDWELE